MMIDMKRHKLDNFLCLRRYDFSGRPLYVPATDNLVIVSLVGKLFSLRSSFPKPRVFVYFRRYVIQHKWCITESAFRIQDGYLGTRT
jgi:hypothetical protein